ncbi:MAG: hypothetical protein Q7T03_00265 [Deltaproteobacteria bacterium]|nr:hypothetical protein [Deltaproteobacteria bacterium]
MLNGIGNMGMAGMVAQTNLVTAQTTVATNLAPDVFAGVVSNAGADVLRAHARDVRLPRFASAAVAVAILTRAKEAFALPYDPIEGADLFRQIGSPIVLAGSLVALGGVIALIGSSRVSLQNIWREQIKSYEEELDAALQMMKIFEGEEFGTRFSEMGKKTGKTLDLYNQTYDQIVRLYLGLEGAKIQIQEAKKMLEEARFWNVRPLDRTIRHLESSYALRVGLSQKLPPAFRSFNGATRMESVDEFLDKLYASFEEARAGWERLHSSVEKASEDPSVLFPDTVFSQWNECLASAGLPDKWINDHPLFYDRAHILKRLGHLRFKDPVSYADTVEQYQKKEGEIQIRVDALVQAIKEVETNKKKADAIDISDPLAELPEDDELCVTERRGQELMAQVDELGMAGIDAEALLAKAIEADEIYYRLHILNMHMREGLEAVPFTLPGQDTYYNNVAAGIRSEETEAGKFLAQARAHLEKAKRAFSEEKNLLAYREEQAFLEACRMALSSARDKIAAAV